MIRAIVQNGVIRPIEPLPPDWQDGREVVVGIAPECSANGGASESFVQRASRSTTPDIGTPHSICSTMALMN